MTFDLNVLTRSRNTDNLFLSEVKDLHNKMHARGVAHMGRSNNAPRIYRSAEVFVKMSGLQLRASKLYNALRSISSIIPLTKHFFLRHDLCSRRVRIGFSTCAATCAAMRPPPPIIGFLQENPMATEYDLLRSLLDRPEKHNRQPRRRFAKNLTIRRLLSSLRARAMRSRLLG
jgi:hypothetical protein